MAAQNVSFNAESVEVNPGPVRGYVSLEVKGADVGEVLANFDNGQLLTDMSAQEVLEHIDRDEFLDQIGEDYAREYFGIE